MKLNNKFSIGCLVQWYEIEMIEEYFLSLKLALENIENKENVIVDIFFNMSTALEKLDENKKDIFYFVREFPKMTKDLIEADLNINVQYLGGNIVHENKKIYTIADYRREFNDKYCEKVDILMWGESDSLIPRQTFEILDNLHDNVKEQTPKYIAFFSVCKMWDDSWKVLEHPEFTDKPFFDSPEDFDPDKHWWSLRYTMGIDEMNKFNDNVDELDVQMLNQHKFNGCGLVISSEVIKAGVNIPRSMFFVHEDTSFMMMIQRILGMIPQFVIKNILLVHNRNHPKKRMYVEGEDGKTLNLRRRSNEWYVKANEMSEKNCYNVSNPNYKSFTWEDVWK
tara:strand:- start:3125 stop:4135 length:1011 start_codon:yes stop_codon:yes gene_type:complete